MSRGLLPAAMADGALRSAHPIGEMSERSRVLNSEAMRLKTLAILAAIVVSQASFTAAQEEPREVGQIIGRAIAAGVVLATDEFAAAGRYEVDDDADSSFRVRQLGHRHRFERAGRWRPFVGATLGQVLVQQKIDLGNGSRSDSEFDVWGLAVNGGARVVLSDGWYGELRGVASYSFAESDLRYPDAETADLLGPLIDGVLFNWEAEAVTLEAGIDLGWERRSARGTTTRLHGGTTWLRTDPVSTDDPVQDVTVESHFERLQVGLEIPLGTTLFDLPLRFDPRVRHTFLSNDLARPLDSDSFTDVKIVLLALLPEGSRWRISGLGLAVTYTTADAFEGWSVGLSFGT